jgi:predicted MPP superfamily phosphohydrolase
MPEDKFPRRGAVKFIGATSLGLGLSGVLGYLYAFQFEPHWLETTHIQIPIANLPTAFEGFKLVCLSDFHHEPGDGLRYIQKLVEAANRLQPDVICLLGDFVFSDAHSIDALARVISELHAPYGVHAVLGNHDYWTDPDIVKQGLEQVGIAVLINAGVSIQRGEQTIYIVGMDDGWSGIPDPGLALEGVPVDVPVILLMHEPDFAGSISDLNRVDLQISGHSHGGQIKPLFIEAPIRPAFARKYSAGLYEVGDMQLYVTRGVGTIPPRARFNCRPEISEIVLIPA